MNLNRYKKLRIEDAFADYTKAAVVFPDNFFVNLARILVKYRKQPGSYQFDRKNNPDARLVIEDEPVPSMTVIVNGKKFKEKGNGLKPIEGIVSELFKAESAGDITINRPEGKSLYTDRQEFKDIDGTVFPKLFTVTGGKESVAATKANKAEYLTPKQLAIWQRDRKGFDLDKYYKVRVSHLGNDVVYIRKDLKVIDITEDANRIDVEAEWDASDFSNFSDELYHTKSGKELFDRLEYYKDPAVFYKRGWNLYRMELDNGNYIINKVK